MKRIQPSIIAGDVNFVEDPRLGRLNAAANGY